MCGLAGLARFTRYKSTGDNVIVEKMCDALAHRGRNGRGILQDTKSSVVLGHCRLSIIELSRNSDQPFRSVCGRFLLVFNGEIYNYRDLTSDLRGAGYKGSLQGDTQVLMAAYIIWGEGCLDKLQGMFAFAIWDRKKQELFCARDHLGIKPLYWHFDYQHQTFLWASEIGALLASGVPSRFISKTGLSDYMRFGSVSAPNTMIQNIYALQPGHCMLVSKKGVLIRRYWDIETFAPDQTRSMSYDDAQQMVRDGFGQAMERHLVADVPKGIFLSGGIDSSLIAGYTSKVRGERLSSYSLGFSGGGSELNETNLARKVAQKFGFDHHEVMVGSEAFDTTVDDFIGVIDQPSIDGLNTFLIARSVKSDCKVILSGLGGDELFYGYRSMRDLARVAKMSESSIGRALVNGACYVGGMPLGKSLLYRLGIRPVIHTEKGFGAMYAHSRSIRSNNQVDLLIAPKLDGSDRFFHEFSSNEKSYDQQLAAISRAELSQYTSSMLLRDADVMSMASTLELRVPFLDRSFVEMMLQISGSFKIGNNDVSKPLLIDACRDLIPNCVINQPKKGFEIPLGHWLLSLDKSKLISIGNRSWINQPVWQQIVDQLEQNPGTYVSAWSIIVLCRWIDHHNLSLPFD